MPVLLWPSFVMKCDLQMYKHKNTTFWKLLQNVFHQRHTLLIRSQHLHQTILSEIFISNSYDNRNWWYTADHHRKPTEPTCNISKPHIVDRTQYLSRNRPFHQNGNCEMQPHICVESVPPVSCFDRSFTVDGAAASLFLKTLVALIGSTSPFTISFSFTASSTPLPLFTTLWIAVHSEAGSHVLPHPSPHNSVIKIRT